MSNETLVQTQTQRTQASPLQRVKIVVSGEDGTEQNFSMGARPVRLGSGEDADIRLTDAHISRNHAEFRIEGHAIRVRDLSSTNGTRFQGSEISDVLLDLGSAIEVGTHRVWFAPLESPPLPPSDRVRFGDLVGESLPMRELFAVLEAAARTDATVLIQGESGTGKELIARALHAESDRRDAPFVVLDSAGLHEATADSMLFGHRRGAFTGAVHDRRGAFHQAHGGTLFIDEVGELSAQTQAKLLRAIETRTIQPLGSDTRESVDVRLVAATLQPLEDMVERGAFRFDLLQRLSVVEVSPPPLRERKGDIPTLVQSFFSQLGVEPGPVEGENLSKLMAYAWPGNVRELKNAIERGLVFARGSKGFNDLQIRLGQYEHEPEFTINADIDYHSAKETLLETFERAYVTQVIARSGGNISRAAERSGLSRRHLRELLKKHGLYEHE